MWDLDQLRIMNEEAHQRAVERAQQKSQAPTSGHPIYPLGELARVLIVGPPHIGYIADLLQNSEVVAEFHELVTTYLAEHEQFIMSQDNEGKIREFAFYFQRRYFPLSDNIVLGEYTLGDFVAEIPVDLMGFSYDDYHGFADFREGYILMLALVECPYEDAGSRIPILEKVKELVGLDLAELIPQGGWPTADLHRLVDGTEFAGLASFADWVNADTGCMLLDADYEQYTSEPWNWTLVQDLTDQWPKVVEINDKMHNMAVWLEEDLLCYRFRELLAFLLDRKDMIVPKEQLAFPLDENGQVIMEATNGNNGGETEVRLGGARGAEDTARSAALPA